MRHTPGPWSDERVWDIPETKVHAYCCGKPYALAMIYPMPGVGELEANAKLIAAAPEMARELENAADMFCEIAKECAHCNYGRGATGKSSDGDSECEECAPVREAERRARALFAKATGAQS